MKYRPHLLAAALLAAGAAAHAAPFATTYHGTIGADSNIPGANVGEPYSITLIMDNGGNSANGQMWTVTHLTCTLLRFNTGSTASFTANLAGWPFSYRQMLTGPTGTMTDMFVPFGVTVQAGEYSSTGLTLQPPLSVSFGGGYVLSYGLSTNTITDAAGGVIMNPGGWSSPIAVAGSCDDTPLAPPPPPPGSPTGVTAQAGNEQVTVSWRPPSGSTPPLSYTVYTRTRYDGFYGRSCTVEHPATSCTVAPLSNDQPYTFVVTAAAPRSRPSAPSNPVTATPRANARPGDVQAVPALGLPALALLGAAAAGLGALRLRRRS